MILYAIVDKKKPIITFNNLIPAKDRKHIRLRKNEKIIRVQVVKTK